MKIDLIGSLAGPESPRPWSQRTKLRAAMASEALGGDEAVRRSVVMARVMARATADTRAIGLVNGATFISGLPWFGLCEETIRDWSR